MSIPLISAAQTEIKVFETDQFGIQNIQPSQIIIEDKEEIRVYDVTNFGRSAKGFCPQKEINPEQIIEKTETEIKVYEVNQFGQKEMTPSLIIKREDVTEDK